MTMPKEYEYIFGLDGQPCPRCKSRNTWFDCSDNDLTECQSVICRDCGCNT